MVEEGGFREGDLGVLKGFLALGSPHQGLRFPLERVKEVEEVVGCIADEATIVTNNSEEPLQFLDGGWWFCLFDRRDPVLEWRDS